MPPINFLNQVYPKPIQATKIWNIVDPSKLNCFQTCERKFFFQYVLGWQPEAENLHFIFGTAWHLAMEHLSWHGFGEKSRDEAFQKFLAYYRQYFGELTDLDKAPKNPGNARLAIDEYCETYAAIDFQLETLHTEILVTVPINNNGRYMVGRMDKILKHPTNGIVGFDFKTGSRRSAAWEGQWKTSLQMAFYAHVLSLAFLEQKVWGMEVDGVFFYKHKQRDAVTKNLPVRVPVRKTPDIQAAFLSDLNHQVDMLEWNFEGLAKANIDDQVLNAFPRRTSSCTMYNNLCQFHPYCTAWANPLRYCHEVPMGLKVEHWNPCEDYKKPAPKETFDGKLFQPTR